MPTALSGETFGRFVSTACNPVLVKFYAPGCSFCGASSPMFAGLESAYGGRVCFAEVNTDREAAVATHEKITGLPTFILYDGGRRVGVVEGYDASSTPARLRVGLDRSVKR